MTESPLTIKTAICCLNSKYVHVSSAPWCLAAGIREYAKSGVSFTVHQSTVNADLNEFTEKIISERPDAVSFSCYIWNIEKTLQVCENIKKELDCVIVLGGPEVAYRPENLLSEYPFIDYVLSGEGEFCFPLFIDMLCGMYRKQEIPGLTFRDEADTVSVPEKAFCITPPSPVCDEYLDALDGRICYIESSRGCPFRCAFCLSGRVSGLRFFDPEVTKKDIIRLANSGTKTVKFVDRTFNASENHANGILSFIKENYGKSIPDGVCFHFEIAGDILKESTFEILSRMPKGAVQLEIGMQSFNEKTLAAVNRKTDTDKLIANIKRLIGFGNMHIHIDLIAGLTGEDLESFEKSFDTGFGLHAHLLQMGFLKLLYGADMREHPDRYPCTFSEKPPYEVTSTPWLSESEISDLKKCEDVLDRMYNSGRFLFTVDYLIKEAGFSPFRLFYGFGTSGKARTGSLGDFALSVFEYFKDHCDGDLLREKILCDLLCCVSALQIPKIFKPAHPLYKRAKAAFSENGSVKVAVLGKSNVIFAADQSSERDLYGRFSYKFYDIKTLERS